MTSSPTPSRSPSPRSKPPRAWQRMLSGRRLDLLDPSPLDVEIEDIAHGLARVARWYGQTKGPHSFSVAQHSLSVLALRQRAPATRDELRRELLHDAEEGLTNFDCISPLKPFLGEGFLELQHRLSVVIAARYALPAWRAPERVQHKRLDIVMAAAEAVHVAGWAPVEVRATLGIRAPVLREDPLQAEFGGTPWEPWAPEVAAARFLAALRRLS